MEQYDDVTRGVPVLHFLWGRLYHLNVIRQNQSEAFKYVNLLRLTAFNVPKVSVIMSNVSRDCERRVQAVLVYYHKHAREATEANIPPKHASLAYQYMAEKATLEHFKTYPRESPETIAAHPRVFTTPDVINFEAGRIVVLTYWRALMCL